MKKTLKATYINDVTGVSEEAFQMADGDWDLARKIERIQVEQGSVAKHKLIWGWIKNDVLNFKDFSKLMDLYNVKII